jgi:hypothetical protein
MVAQEFNNQLLEQAVVFAIGPEKARVDAIAGQR